MSLKSQMIEGPTGSLELLSSLPITTATTTTPPPLLFLHGLSCSAHCYQNFLPYLARRGYAAYALSLRDHGASHRQGWLARTLGTTLPGWGRDVEAALAHVAAAHPGAPAPVLGGHSLGGGLAQWLASAAAPGRPPLVSALVLLGAAPLRGGGREILAHWRAVETETGGRGGGAAAAGGHWLWGARCQLQTPAQVRAAFFSDATPDAAVDAWLRECRSAQGNARASASILWPFGDAARVLAHLPGLGPGPGPDRPSPAPARKVLCVAGSADRLVPPAMVLDNYRAYQTAEAAEGVAVGESCAFLLVQGSGHHLMMDAHWEECADGIVQWLGGQAAVQA